MLETEDAAHIGVGQHPVQVACLYQVTFLVVGALLVVAAVVIADAPHVAGRRSEHHRIVDALAVAGEDVVARDAQRIESRNRDVGEDRNVRRRSDRVRTVYAVESGRQQSDAETRILRIAGASGEGEVDFLLERAVARRSLEIFHHAPREREPFLRLGLFRKRGIAVMQRVAAVDIHSLLGRSLQREAKG